MDREERGERRRVITGKLAVLWCIQRAVQSWLTSQWCIKESSICQTGGDELPGLSFLISTFFFFSHPLFNPFFTTGLKRWREGNGFERESEARLHSPSRSLSFFFSPRRAVMSYRFLSSSDAGRRMHRGRFSRRRRFSRPSSGGPSRYSFTRCGVFPRVAQIPAVKKAKNKANGKKNFFPHNLT